MKEYSYAHTTERWIRTKVISAFLLFTLTTWQYEKSKRKFGKSYAPRRLSEEVDSSKNEQMEQIISADMNLISIEFPVGHSLKNDSYTGIIGVFCKLDFDKQKQDPHKYPMFRDLVDASGCAATANMVRVDLGNAVELVRDYDAKVFRESYNSGNDVSFNNPSVLSLKGAVFHESRCGSTLAANALVALNPEKNRVYSESAPPKLVLKKCGEDFVDCSMKGAANLLRDVVYLMGRSNDPTEENLFFKFQVRILGDLSLLLPYLYHLTVSVHNNEDNGGIPYSIPYNTLDLFVQRANRGNAKSVGYARYIII
jgi:hypothetical protein